MSGKTSPSGDFSNPYDFKRKVHKYNQLNFLNIKNLLKYKKFIF